MLHRNLGASEIQASVVGLGTWAIGGWMWGGTDEADAIRAIHAGIDAGINLIDTAPIYGFGLSETIVGKAIADRRDKVVLATKCAMVWHVEKGEFLFDSDEKAIGAGKHKVYKYLAPQSIRYEVEQSLARLGVDTIDLYQTHWQESTTPIADTMGELTKLKDEGKIRAIGASNATRAQLEEYSAAGTLDADQERYSMLDRAKETEELPHCAENNIAFLAYSPLALGILTGKIGPDRTFGEGDLRNDNPRFSTENRERVAAMLKGFDPLAEKHNVTMSQLVIAWTIRQFGCSHVLVGARNPQQAQENAAAGAVDLTEEDVSAMDAVIAKHAAAIR